MDYTTNQGMQCTFSGRQTLVVVVNKPNFLKSDHELLPRVAKALLIFEFVCLQGLQGERGPRGAKGIIGEMVSRMLGFTWRWHP